MRALIVIAIVLATLIDGFFAFVNFYPVAPARGKGPKRQVLMVLEPHEAKWVKDNLLDEFNQEHNVDLALEIVDEDHLAGVLSAKRSDVLVAAIPRTLGTRAAKDQLVKSFADVTKPETIATDFSAIRAQAMSAAQLDGKQFFLPRFALLDLIVYRQSMVRDAVRHWSLLRPQIDAALRAANGHGLPSNYSLELAPEQWDGFDRFVIGFYWAHRKYGQQPAHGRVGHRTGEHLDGMWDLAEGLFRAGATEATFAHTDSAAARDFFSWEALYRQHGLFNPAMFAHPIDDDGILDLVQRGELYLATIDQMEAFRLHGGSHSGTPPRVEDPDDLAFAPMPRISSLEVDEKGRPARTGQAFSLREDWVWALPSQSGDPELAYELVKFFWERDNHYRECEALGTLPLRADVVRERSSLFRLVWMDDVFDAVFAEWDHAKPLPDSVEGGLGSIYAQLWDRIVASRGATTSDAIAAMLAAPPVARAMVQLPPPAPPAADKSEGALTEEDDEDPPMAADVELWRGKVELDIAAATDEGGKR